MHSSFHLRAGCRRGCSHLLGVYLALHPPPLFLLTPHPPLFRPCPLDRRIVPRLDKWESTYLLLLSSVA